MKLKLLGIKYPQPKSSAESAQVDSARTPTGAGLCQQFQPQVDSARTPTGAGLRPQNQLPEIGRAHV